MTTIIQASQDVEHAIEGTTALVSGANRGIGKRSPRPCSIAAPRRSTPACATPRPSARRTAAWSRCNSTSPTPTGPRPLRRRARRRRSSTTRASPTRPPCRPAGPDAARAELEANYLALIAMTQAFAPVLATNGGGRSSTCSVASWAASPDAVDLLGVEGRSLELHELSARRAQAAGHARRRRPRRLRRHRSHGRPGPDKIAPAAVAAAALDAVEAGNPRRSSTSSAAGSRPASATTSGALYPQIERDFAALVGSPS